jgi:hypothetical protein
MRSSGAAGAIRQAKIILGGIRQDEKLKLNLILTSIWEDSDETTSPTVRWRLSIGERNFRLLRSRFRDVINCFCDARPGHEPPVSPTANGSCERSQLNRPQRWQTDSNVCQGPKNASRALPAISDGRIDGLSVGLQNSGHDVESTEKAGDNDLTLQSVSELLRTSSQSPRLL